MVGDDRQLGWVGPGGGHGRPPPGMLHTLADNHHQADPSERAALERLRAGNVGVAADWYHQHGRIHTEADHDATLRGAVEGAADIAAGRTCAVVPTRRGAPNPA